MKILLLILISLILAMRHRGGLSIYDYMTVLRTTEWKAGRQVQRDMLRYFRVNLSYGTLYTDMRRLEEEGFVESKDSETRAGLVREFRLTNGGLRRKNFRSVPDGEAADSRLPA